MNMYLYGHRRGRNCQWLMVDCGVKFGDERTPGIDVILPDSSFIEQQQKNLLGIIITHAHEDHIGAVPWLWERLRAPVYCTPFAGELLRQKLLEADLLGEVPLHIMPLSAQFELGRFEVEFVSVTHSIPEPNAIVLRSPAGNIVHSGDFKIDYTPTISPDMNTNRLEELGKEGVRALVCDSTNVFQRGFSPSESEVAQNLANIIAGAKKRVAITTFASHVGRLKSAISAARANDREVVVAGRAMHRIIAAAREVGLLDDIGPLVPEEDFGHIPRAKVLLLCTGSQGEPRASVARIAADAHPNITLDAGDTVIFSSKTIPGNEKSVAAIHNALTGQGVKLVTIDQALVHSSGHPRREELKQVYDWLKPDVLVPMHGETRHLIEHVEFARECGIAETLLVENGYLAKLAPQPAQVIEKIDAGRRYVDGRLIIDEEISPVRFRRKLSHAGIIVISLVVDEKGRLEADSEVVVDGLPELDANGEYLRDVLLDIAEEAVEELPLAQGRDDVALADTVRARLRRHCEAFWGKRPVCRVIIHRL